MPNAPTLESLKQQFAEILKNAKVRELPTPAKRAAAYNKLLGKFKHAHRAELNALRQIIPPSEEISMDKLEKIAGGIEVPMVNSESLSGILGSSTKNPFF